MTVEHVNRRGDKYLLQAGKTKTGKPKYWFGRKLTGSPVEDVPEGYEIYEHPEDSQVFLRKRTPSPISPIEQELLASGIRRRAGLKHFLIDVQGKSLVVYLPDGSSEAAAGAIAELLGGLPSARDAIEQWTVAHVRYSKMMRFTLFNEDERLFTVERWCFRGSIDDWIWLAPPAPLDELIEEYAPHLGKETFCELI